ncbi:unnamed protein product [Orchesella dallaii]|uniref:Uncharacterized protein n=1 Tax=Orchesella dallaii TaxID=48710 RepID=A0ABP1PZI7_9HEXA
MKWQWRARIFAKIDVLISMVNFGFWGNSGMMGFFLIVIQLLFAISLSSLIEKKNLDGCRYWMKVTIFTSIIYINYEFSLLSCTHPRSEFASHACGLLAGFTFFKISELAVVYSFIKELKESRTPIPSVPAGIPPPAQPQVVLPQGVATNLNTSTAIPSAAPQPQEVLPHVVVTDLAPACLENQNQPSSVNILTPDLPPSYNESQSRDECVEPPPPSYDEVMKPSK